MSSSRLPHRLWLRCLLVFSLGVAVLVPLGLVALFLMLSIGGIDAGPSVTRLPGENRTVVGPVELPEEAKGPTREGSSGSVNTQIAEVVASSQRRSSEENLNQLDQMSERLNKVASDESVDDLSSQLRGWMGLESRASQPQATAHSIDFDIDTAQLHDVKRVEREPGKYEYSAVLIDAQGRTREIGLTEAEGKETYSLMQRIKSNPLLEKVYRQLAMPLLDSLVRSARDGGDTSSR